MFFIDFLINSVDDSMLVGVKSLDVNFDKIGSISVLYLNVRISIIEFADGEIGFDCSTT